MKILIYPLLYIKLFSIPLFCAEVDPSFSWSASVESFAHLERLVKEQRVSVNMLDCDNKTALMAAIEKGCNQSIEFLLDQGAEIDGLSTSTNRLHSSGTYTPLNYLIIKCTKVDVITMIRMLLMRGADVNKYPSEIHSAIEAHIIFGTMGSTRELLRLLIEYGLDLKEIFLGAALAELGVARSNSFFTEESYYRQLQDLYLLLEFGIEISKTFEKQVYSNMSKKPILLSVIRNSPQTLDTSHISQPKLNVMLRYAAKRGDIGMVDVLLKAGASPSVRDAQSVSTLQVMQHLAYNVRPSKQHEYRVIYGMLCNAIAWPTLTSSIGGVTLPSDVVGYMARFGVGDELIAMRRRAVKQQSAAHCEVM